MKIKRIISVLFVALIVLTVAPLGGFINASAVNDKSVSVQFIVDNDGKYMETFTIDFSIAQREANSVTINIKWTNTINANKYDAFRYDAEVKCGSVTTGRKIVVPKNTWPKSVKSNVPRSKNASSTLKIPLSTQNETTVNLVCLQYQCDANGKILYTEKEKPGTVKYTIPKYTAPTAKYTLSYNANGGTGAPANQTGAAKYTISSTKPSRSGYTFLGWSKSNTATSSSYSSGSSITLTANTTLYAVWKKNETANIYNRGEETYSFKNIVDCDNKSWCVNGYHKGHCFGMSLSSEAFYTGVLDEKSYGANTVYGLSKTSKLMDIICTYQNRQSNRTIVTGGRTYKGNTKNISADWNDVINYVKDHSYDNKGNLIVSFRKGSYGHAVDFLYYKEVNGQQRIYIYDSNYPDTETYLYKGSDGKVYETPKATYNYIDCIALRSYQKCINFVGDYDGTHVIYAEDGAIEVEGATVSPLDCGEEGAYVAFEIPDNYCEVFITPLVDNAEFSYLEETYDFGDVNYDTYGIFVLASNYDGSAGDDQVFRIENANITDDISINYKSSAKISVNVDNPKNIIYESSDPSVATVDSDGNISTVSKGVASITCTVTDASGNTLVDTCTVTVKFQWWQWLIRILLFGFLWY